MPISPRSTKSDARLEGDEHDSRHDQSDASQCRRIETLTPKKDRGTADERNADTSPNSVDEADRHVLEDYAQHDASDGIEEDRNQSPPPLGQAIRELQKQRGY